MQPEHQHAFSESRASRRGLLAAAALPFLVRRASAAAASSSRTLVIVNLRGGADLLSLCGPFTDGVYTGARPTLSIPTTGTNAATPLAGPGSYFWLSPAGAALLPAYNAGELAFVHTAGVTGQTLSHFDAMYALETANDPLNVDPNLSTGWAGRFLENSGTVAPLRAVHQGKLAPRVLVGGSDKVLLPDPDPQTYVLPQLAVAGGPAEEAYRRLRLQDMYTADVDYLRSAGLSTLSAISLVSQVALNNGTYPASKFGAEMHSVASLLTAQHGPTPPPGLCLDVAHVDYGDWDDHDAQGATAPGGAFYDRAKDLCDTLEAFRNDMAARGLADTYVVVVLSEFGRRIAENSTATGAGTDHGHGNCWIVMSQGMNGGQVLSGAWDGSTNHDLASVTDPFGNLEIHYELDDILADILLARLGLTDAEIARIFPAATSIQGTGLF